MKLPAPVVNNSPEVASDSDASTQQADSPAQPTPEQAFQEQLYTYPYHYIPFWDGHIFSQITSLHWGYEYLSYLHFVLDYLGTVAFSSLLDVGCGDGRFLTELNRHYPERRLVGLDYSARAIALARGLAPHLTWVRADITTAAAPTEQFDVVTLLETLEHIPTDQLQGFLDAIHRRLSAEGLFLLTVPSLNVPVNVHHVQHFDLPSVQSVLAGRFAIEKVCYLNRNSRAISWLFRSVIHNSVFVLNQRHLLTLLFKWYRKHFLVAESGTCKRIFVACRPIGSTPD